MNSGIRKGSNKFNIQCFQPISLRAEETIVSLIAILGTLGDQLSTRLSLNLPYISESNPMVIWLMQNRLWLTFDLIILITILLIPILCIRKTSIEGGSMLLAFPLIFGICRISATFLNIILVLNI